MECRRTVAGAAAFLLALFSFSSTSAEPAYVGAVRDYVEKHIKPILDNPIVLAAIQAQNAENKGIKQDTIDKLDNEWRAEIASHDWHLIQQVLANPVSQYFMGKQRDSQGAIIELFVTDAHGLNVGQSRETMDYWQGDEDKYLRTFAAGRKDIFIDEADRDEATQALECQASFAIYDKDIPVGILTVTIALDAL